MIDQMSSHFACEIFEQNLERTKAAENTHITECMAEFLRFDCQ